MKPAPFNSTFALLDVMQGRAALVKRLAKSGPIRVRVEMVLDYPHGGDDGTSIEMSCTVTSVKEYGK